VTSGKIVLPVKNERMKQSGRTPRRLTLKSCVTILGFLACYSAYAQPCNYSAGTKTLYTPPQKTYTNPPAGYLPAFINHVGRHGARHLTKDVASYKAFQLLMKADSANGLTVDGKRLKGMLLALRELESQHLKSISIAGRAEQINLASRMVQANPSLFSSPVSVRIKITKEIRTAETADAFLKGLGNRVNGPAPAKVIDDTALRFFDLSPAYVAFQEKGSWEKTVHTLTSSEVYKNAAQAFAGRIFLEPYLPADAIAFSKDISGFALIIPSIKKEATDSSFFQLEKLFTCEEWQQFAKLDQLEDYLLKGPGEDSMGIQIKIAAPLLLQFLRSTDEFISHPAKQLELRFAHAETISPIAALMQLTGASTPVAIATEFRNTWKPEEIIPLSANIQWIVYQKPGSKDFLLRILLNEKETLIKGLKPKKYPYYELTQVRAFYMKILSGLGANLDTSMPEFLKALY
jgi:multiple inositol-polyphosphate phosphatase/2,3-bisphosphoglycerate 3-phosphatase